jgi:hypothetical protein
LFLPESQAFLYWGWHPNEAAIWQSCEASFESGNLFAHPYVKSIGIELPNKSFSTFLASQACCLFDSS